MGWRKGHGNTHSGVPVVIEVQPPDELSVPNPDTMDARLAEQKRIGRPFQKGNRAAVGRKPKLARLGIDKDLIAEGKSMYAGYLRDADTYRKRRIQEMRIAHGFVSVGSAAIMATAALCLAASRYLSALASQTEFPDMEMLKKASALGIDARQNELAAWELCSREASAKTRAQANDTPWMAKSRLPKVRVEPSLESEPPSEDDRKKAVAEWHLRS